MLFVRHTYGDRRAWEIPGGGLRRREEPEAAVRREMREELGVGLAGLRELGRVDVRGHGKRTLLVCFVAHAGGAPLRVDDVELAEVRWAPVHAPPQPLGPDAAAVLDLLAAGARAASAGG